MRTRIVTALLIALSAAVAQADGLLYKVRVHSGKLILRGLQGAR